MDSFTGGQPHIQRVVRRAYSIIKSSDSVFTKLFPGGFLNVFLKAITIAIFEELANYNTLKNNMIPDGLIEFEVTTESTLDPMPYDNES